MAPASPEMAHQAASPTAKKTLVPMKPVSYARKDPFAPVKKEKLLPPLSRVQRLSRFFMACGGDILCTLMICGVLWGMMPFAFLEHANLPETVPLNLVTFVATTAVLALIAIRFVVSVGRASRFHRWQMFWLLGVTGLFVVGPSAFFLDQWLMVDTHRPDIAMSEGLFPFVGPYATTMNGQVTLAGYSAFFGILLAMRSWWKMTDDARPYRFSVAAIFNTVFVAILGVILLDHLPWIWCLLWGAMIATALQVSSPVRRYPEQQEYRYWKRA